MFSFVPFVVCVILRYHFGDTVPWWVWTLSILTLLVATDKFTIVSKSAWEDA